MTQNDLLLLNIGAGTQKLPGFVNIDIEPGADIVLDVRKGLPFASNSVDGIYSEHFIEHVVQGDICFFLRECRRVLAPGGIMRVATPDLDEIIADYVRGGAQSGANPHSWLHPEWAKYDYEWVANRCEMLNLAMREWGHQWLVNEEELRRLGIFCGLRVLDRRTWGDSPTPWLRGLETRSGSNLIVEFQKPLRQAFGGEPLVSVCIPAYKPTYFAATIESALKQTYRNIEIVVSDDSRDGSIQVAVQPYLADPRVRYARNPVHGGDENYINALVHARGDYIKYLNDDDLLEPNCVARLLQTAEANPDATLIASAREQFECDGAVSINAGAFKPITDIDIVVDGQHAMYLMMDRLSNFIGEPNCTLFRREDTLAISPNLLTLGGQKNVNGTPGDVVMWLNLLSQGDLIYLADSLSKMRVHPHQITQQVNYQSMGMQAWYRLARQAERFGMKKTNGCGLQPVTPLASRTVAGDKTAIDEIGILIDAGRFPEAIALVQQLIDTRGPTEFSLTLLVQLHAQSGQAEQARTIQQTALQRFPESQTLRGCLGHGAATYY